MDSSGSGYANGNGRCGGLTSIVPTFSYQTNSSSTGDCADVDDGRYSSVYRIFREGKGWGANSMVHVHRSRISSVTPFSLSLILGLSRSGE